MNKYLIISYCKGLDMVPSFIHIRDVSVIYCFIGSVIYCFIFMA